MLNHIALEKDCWVIVLGESKSDQKSPESFIK